MNKTLTLTSVLCALAFGQEKSWNYDAGELRFYISTGVQLGFHNSEDINKILGGLDVTTPKTKFYPTGSKEGKDTILFQGTGDLGYAPFNKGSFGAFNENNVLNMTHLGFEAGAKYNRWQFGTRFSRSQTVTSKRPSETMSFSWAGRGWFLDTLGTPIPNSVVSLYDASVNITDFGITLGREFKVSALSLTPRLLLGFSSVNVKFPGAFSLYHPEVDNILLKPYILRDRTYSSLGLHYGLELVPSVRVKALELSVPVSYNFIRYSSFKIGDVDSIQYGYGPSEANLDNYNIGLRLTYTMPSKNDLERGLPKRQ